MKQITVLFAVLLLCAFAGCSSSNRCDEQIRAKCTGCHSIEKICSQPGKKYASWERTVGQMMRLNAPISTEDKKKIARCLASTKKLNNLCNKQAKR